MLKFKKFIVNHLLGLVILFAFIVIFGYPFLILKVFDFKEIYISDYDRVNSIYNDPKYNAIKPLIKSSFSDGKITFGEYENMQNAVLEIDKLKLANQINSAN